MGEFTFGQKRTGVPNKASYEPANTMKQKVAEMIDYIEGQKLPAFPDLDNRERHRLIALAQTKFEEACMFAVKAMYTEDKK